MTDQTMLAAVYHNNHDVRLEQMPVPRIGPGELLVEVEACGLCTGETSEAYQIPRGPRVQGHEPVGVVVEVGEGQDRFAVGDRVFVHHHVPCMSCHNCNRGHFTQCSHWHETGIDPGGFAEYFRVPEENARLDTHFLPSEIPAEAGVVVEPMACALRGLRQSDIHPGDTVAIVGSGFMGLCFLQLSKLWPVAKICVLGHNRWRLDRATELGADLVLNPREVDAAAALRDHNQGRGADAVFVTASSLDAYNTGLSLCNRGGDLHLNAPGPSGSEWAIDPYDLFFREIAIHSAYSADHRATSSVVELLINGRVDPVPLITHRFGLDSLEEAIRLVLESRQSLKPMIIPSLTKRL